MTVVENIIKFCEENVNQDFNSHRGAYFNVIKFCKEEAKEMENQKDAKYNEMLETLEIVAKKLNGNGFPSLQNQIEKVIKDVKFKNK
jgi:Zn-dependent M32 family carboxypeptidase